MDQPARITKRRAEAIKAIRELILANPGKTLTAPDFQKAAGTTMANKVLYDLVEEGRVLKARPKDGVRGNRFIYVWIEGQDDAEIVQPAEHTVKMPELPMTDAELEKLEKNIGFYIDEHSGKVLDEYIVGVILYKQWLKETLKSAKSARKTAVLHTLHKD